MAHHFLYQWTPKLFLTEPFLPEHREIVELMLDNKVDGAAERLGAHLRDSRDRAIARVDAIRSALVMEEISFLTLAP